MSILSTTNSGFKYFSPEGIINRCCELTLNGMRVGIRVTTCEDGGVDISPDVDIANIKLKLYFHTVYKKDCPGNFNLSKLHLPMNTLAFIGNQEKFLLTIKEPPDRKIKVNNINCDLSINCEFELSDFFDKTKIHGYVASKIYDENTLFSNNIHPYYGEDIVGY
jgi:hypothetical protein